MRAAQRIPWLRITAESAAIVASILLAFAIDAWWQTRIEDRIRASQLESLADEFEANMSEVTELMDLHRGSIDGATMFLEVLRSVPVGGPVSVPAEVVALALTTPTFDPSTGAYDTLIITGQLINLGSAEMRTALAAWPGALADANEEEEAAKSLVESQLMPYLTRLIPLQPLFDFDPHQGFDGNAPAPVDLTRTVELENILAARRQYSSLALDGLTRLSERLTEIQRFLDTESSE